MQVAALQPYPYILSLPAAHHAPLLASMLPLANGMFEYHLRQLMSNAVQRMPLAAFLGPLWNANAFQRPFAAHVMLDARFLCGLGMMQGATTFPPNYVVGGLLRGLVLNGQLTATIPVSLMLNARGIITIACRASPCGREQPLATLLQPTSFWRVPTVLGAAAHMTAIGLTPEEYRIPRDMRTHIGADVALDNLADFFVTRDPAREYGVYINIETPLRNFTSPHTLAMQVRQTTRQLIEMHLTPIPPPSPFAAPLLTDTDDEREDDNTEDGGGTDSD